MAAKIGDRGRAACPLYPSGRVVINRAPMAARAETGPIEEGAEIVVVGGDRFSLVVQAFDPSYSYTTLPNFGETILTAKEEAAFQAEVLDETRRQQEADHRRAFHKLLRFAAIAGVVIGVGLVAFQSSLRGYTDDLVWIPFLSSACWFCVTYLAFFLGAATENILVFVSIPCALAGLIVGMLWWGPFTAIALCFMVGISVTTMALLIEAMRHPVT
jgi:hypothetical protein